MIERLERVGKEFRLPGKIYAYTELHSGHINSTYQVTYQNEGRTKNYIFQVVNVVVFQRPLEVMENIDRVTEHIRTHFPEEKTLHFHHRADGTNYFTDEDNQFWRVVNYVDSISFDSTDDLSLNAALGYAIGKFEEELKDFDPRSLHETIYDFHNTYRRFQKLDRDIAEDSVGRVQDVQEELAWLMEMRDTMCELSIGYMNGAYPIRVTHNDTKCNNVLFDRITKQPLCLIDLDTIMPGLAMWDFGDAIRSAANTAAEDEPDITKIHLNVEKFRAIARGYLKAAKAILEPEEMDTLVLGAFTMTAEVALRFIDDYIVGDQYFHINYPQHNLVRGRDQIALAKEIFLRREELEQIIREESR